MTVQCPRCRTQYKIPTARINDPRPVFKCTRCSLVFASEPERGARGGKAKEDKNLSLPFSSRKEPGRAKPAAAEVDEDAPTIRSLRDAAPDEEDESELEEVESEEDESDEDGEEEEEESADEEEDAEEEDVGAEEEPARPARRPRRSKAAVEDDAAEPAFARAERERAAERERIAAEKERAAAEKAAEKERARIAAEKDRLAAEKERLAAEKERQRAAAEREKERARAAAEKERVRVAEARRREREDLRLRDEEEEEIEDEGPDDLGEDDDDDEPRRPVLRASESKQRRAPINPRRSIRSATMATRSKSPLKTVTVGVAAVVLAYVAGALWLGSSSEAAIATLSRVPVLGSLLGGDHLLVWRLQLTDVDGGLDQIKGGRPAYVVSGRAVNTSNEDLRVIEIEGRLLVNGVEQRRQTVYAANQQRKTIQDLSPSEVEMLLRLEPNRRFSIRPGESASFLLVFPNPPPGTTEVTCRVLDARNS